MERQNLTNLLKIASHCLFDGWLIQNRSGRYIIGYANKNEVLINDFSNTVKYFIGKKPYQRTRPNAIEIEFGNKKLLQDILQLITLNKHFKNDFYRILISNKELMRIVLKIFWSDEGMVGFYKTKSGITRKLRSRCSNKKLRNQLIMLHRILGINAYEEYDKKGILITDRKSIKLFSSKINFTNGVKVVKTNGSKSVWKGTDKSDVLNLLLNSYEN